eukprot:593778-Pelagomonas_calceolata.AAC.5
MRREHNGGGRDLRPVTTQVRPRPNDPMWLDIMQNRTHWAWHGMAPRDTSLGSHLGPKPACSTMACGLCSSCHLTGTPEQGCSAAHAAALLCYLFPCASFRHATPLLRRFDGVNGHQAPDSLLPWVVSVDDELPTLDAIFNVGG